MLTNEVDQERSIRFYRWAMAEAEREVRENYPLLRQISSVDAQKYLAVVASMGLEEQLRLMRALVNWAHSAARRLLGQEYSDSEAALRQDYLIESRYLASRIKAKLLAPEPNDLPYQKRRFSRLLKQRLKPIFGQPLTKNESMYVDSDLVYVTSIPGWYIGTRIQFLNGMKELRYWQNVMALPHEFPGSLGNPAHNGTDILSWLGLGRTEVEVPFERCEESTADVMALVCTRFLDAMPEVLSGLKAEVMDENNWNRVFWWQDIRRYKILKVE